ncbi:MAG: glycosyltransferase [Candidatus Rokubacteria bacterium]|nr:glycosyltransferase [Candidatus Rokubacteria bacterium]
MLSAALIVRDEEAVLPACLESLAPVVDEIVVVDTGSRDATPRIARDAGAVVYDVPWRDDFAAARNHALDRARGEWILYIDADERVRALDGAARAALRGHLADPGFVGYFVMLQSRAGVTAYREMRVFRNRPEIRFRGVIHENIWPGVIAYRRTHGGAIGVSPLILDHVGYDGDQAHKHRRNLPLLREALRQDPERVYCWCHLASIHAAQGEDAEAEAAWLRALAIVRGKDRHLPEDVLPYLGLAGWRAARGEDVEPLVAEARGRFPYHLQVQWLQARAWMAAGRYEAAIPLLEGLVRCGETGAYDRSSAYDVRLFTLLPYEALATCLFRLGRYEESARYYGLAASHDPEPLKHRIKQQLCARLAGERPGVPR